MHPNRGCAPALISYILYLISYILSLIPHKKLVLPRYKASVLRVQAVCTASTKRLYDQYKGFVPMFSGQKLKTNYHEFHEFHEFPEAPKP